MKCPRCGSLNLLVTTEQLSAKTRERAPGCLWSIGRALLIICTCGLWLLVGRRRGTAKTKFKNQTVAICQSCGNQWRV
ncbi:MAG TPA: hypothetical protein PK854_10375 [Oscillospiraceae bacterium]|nr:hypothetical protein [Oscillospiraceae bacterium]HPS35659.1 hypothetical protein [Oscillospiraceae bacterium]